MRRSRGEPAGAGCALCLLHLHLRLKGGHWLAGAGFRRSLRVPTSKPSLIFNNDNNLPHALWTQAFHLWLHGPFSPHVLGKKKGGQGPLGVCTLTPVLLLECFPSRSIQSPEPWKEVRGRDAMPLASQTPLVSQGHWQAFGLVA